MTFFDLLKQTEKLLYPIAQEDAKIEALLIVGHAFSLSKADLLSKLKDTIQEKEKTTLKQLKKYQMLIQKRSQFFPLAYLLKHSFFLGKPYTIYPGVLIPRPETEELLTLIQTNVSHEPNNIWELGFGSGVISIELALYYKRSKITAWDISKKAYKNTQKNIEKYGVKNITLICNDFFKENIKEYPDIFVSNPPYISSKAYGELSLDIRLYEPRKALWGGQNGTLFYEKLFNYFKSTKWPKWVFMEIGFDLKAPLYDMLKTHACGSISFFKDSAGLDRFLMIKN